MKQILLLIGFVFFCIAGSVGATSWPSAESSIGYFKISTNPYGVAIYQDGAHASVQFVGARSFTIQGNAVAMPSPIEVRYGRDDIVFDTTYIYTEPTDEQIAYLHKQKITSNDRVVPAPGALYIVNPRIPGMLELVGTSFEIDRDQKLIRGTVNRVIVHDDSTI